MNRFVAPLAIFLTLVVLLWVGLGIDPSRVPSPLIGQPVPEFSLPVLGDANASVSSPADFQGERWLLNVWASWCVSCRYEHANLMQLADEDVFIVGLNYKDQDADALQWLADRGDPYVLSVVDAQGATGIDLGVYGVPETFVVDAAGTIRHKFIGPIVSAADMQTIRDALKDPESTQ